jgi:hypothetical protein
VDTYDCWNRSGGLRNYLSFAMEISITVENDLCKEEMDDETFVYVLDFGFNIGNSLLHVLLSLV